MILGVFEIFVTSRLVEIETKDSQLAQSSSYLSVITFASTILVAIMICLITCLKKKYIKIIFIGFIVIITLLSFVCVFIFSIIGFRCLIGTGFESLWTSTVDIDKTLFEHEYSCCGYKELTVLCGCTSDEEGDCEQTCHDKVIHPFGIMFITSSLGAFATASMLIVVAIMFASKLFCQKHKYIYTRI